MNSGSAKCLLAFCITFALAALTGCERRMDEAALRVYLDQKERVFEDISVQMGTAVWNLYSNEGPSEQLPPKTRFAALFSDDSLNQVVNAWYADRAELQDDRMKRRIELWHNMLTAAKVNYDEEIFRLSTDLETWLDDSEAEGRPADEEVEKQVLKLVRLRNEKAKALGFENYAFLVLSVNGLGPDWFLNFVALLDSVTRGPYSEAVAGIRKQKDTLEASDVRPLLMKGYHRTSESGFEQDELPAVVAGTVGAIGIDYEKLPARFVAEDLPLGVGGQGIAVRIPDDFRAAVTKDASIGTWMHELGHGLQAMFTTEESPVLKGYEWCLGNGNTAWAEGIAETAAGFCRTGEWKKKYSGAEETADERASDPGGSAALMRYQLRSFMFEFELYKNPDRNWKAIQDSLAVVYFDVDKPLTRHFPVANILLVSYPVYLQSYLIGDMISWQIHEALKEKFGETYGSNPEVGDFLREKLYSSGELYPWETRLVMATGKPLDVRGYLKAQGL